jgi:hypothetical protein
MPSASPHSTLQLAIGAQTTVVDLHSPDARPQHWTLPIGLDNLWPAGPSLGGPSALQVENAIQTVEDDIQRLHRHIPAGTRLVMAAEGLKALRRQGVVTGLSGEGFSLDQIEQQYQLLAARAVGAPSAQGSGFDDARGDAWVLILRECLHHWGFDRLCIEG